MKTTTINKAFFAITALMLTFFIARAQDKPAPASPPATATGKVGGASITINYCSPGVKGRTIWGELEPYGKPWRAGANKATEFITDKDLVIDGQTLPAGKYSVFVTPMADAPWVVTFNSETGQWGIKRDGSANFDPAKNVLELKVKPKKSKELTERLVYIINPDNVELRWEYVILPLKVKA